jgi:hypothetical protein
LLPCIYITKRNQGKKLWLIDQTVQVSSTVIFGYFVAPFNPYLEKAESTVLEGKFLFRRFVNSQHQPIKEAQENKPQSFVMVTSPNWVHCSPNLDLKQL